MSKVRSRYAVKQLLAKTLGILALGVAASGASGCGSSKTNASGGSGGTNVGGTGTGGSSDTGGSSQGGDANAGAPGSGGSSGSGHTGGAGGETATGGTAGAAGSSPCGNNQIDTGEECDDGNSFDEDQCTSLCTDNAACVTCFGNNCPFDPSNQPQCSDFTDAASRDACYKTYACLIRTECFFGSGGTLDCYCGDATVVACKDGNGTGACKAEIDAAFAEAPGTLPVVDANAIVDSFFDVSIPAASALNLLQCANAWCGDPALGGQWECSPTRH